MARPFPPAHHRSRLPLWRSLPGQRCQASQALIPGPRRLLSTTSDVGNGTTGSRGLWSTKWYLSAVHCRALCSWHGQWNVPQSHPPSPRALYIHITGYGRASAPPALHTLWKGLRERFLRAAGKGNWLWGN